MSNDISELKRLAGITDTRGKSINPDPPNRSQLNKNIKPGTNEWFKQNFPINDYQMPVGFRGRKKK